VQVRAQRRLREVLLPHPRRQLAHARGRVLSHPLQHVHEVGVRIDAVQPAGDDQALGNASVPGTDLRPTEQPDCIGLPKWLGLRSTDELFGSASELLQTASVLQYPVFLNGENYNGTPGLALRQCIGDGQWPSLAAVVGVGRRAISSVRPPIQRPAI